MTLGIFRDGVLIERVDPDLTLAVDGSRGGEQAERAYHRMGELAAVAGPPGLANGYEVLRICPNHPTRSVVDCEDCDPEETS